MAPGKPYCGCRALGLPPVVAGETSSKKAPPKQGSFLYLHVGQLDACGHEARPLRTHANGYQGGKAAPGTLTSEATKTPRQLCRRGKCEPNKDVRQWCLLFCFGKQPIDHDIVKAAVSGRKKSVQNAFFGHADFLHDPLRGGVFCTAFCLHPVEAHRVKEIADHRLCRFCSVTVAPKRRAELPIQLTPTIAGTEPIDKDLTDNRTAFFFHNGPVCG